MYYNDIKSKIIARKKMRGKESIIIWTTTSSRKP